MPEITFNHHPHFFTATILDWNNLLTDDRMKEIIVSSLRFLVKDGRIKVYGFVLMPNHVHVIWQIQDKYEKSKVQQSFLKYTAQQMKFLLLQNDEKELETYKVKACDREYQFWERNPLSIDLWSRPVFLQKLNYVHKNPTTPRWKLCQCPEEYKYSSAYFYETGKDVFEFLTHYLG
jgi:putative transposase